jgi:hypothetical protein
LSPSETVVAAVARLFASEASGVEVVDRDLVLGRDRRVPLIVADGEGRLVLVLALEKAGDEALILALDALAFARTYRAALARHCESRGVRADLEPSVWIVARDIEEPVRARLEALVSPRVRLFELVRIESRRGAAEYLSEVALAAAPSGAAGPVVPPSFLDGLALDVRPLGETILQRAARLDEDLETAQTGQALAWRVRGDVLGGMEAENGTLRGSITGGEGRTPIDSPADAERFLDGLVQRYLQLTRGSPLAGAEPGLGEPLLTPEELAAFDPTRDPERSFAPAGIAVPP